MSRVVAVLIALTVVVGLGANSALAAAPTRIFVAPVNTKDPAYPRALAKLNNDPLRKTPWAGQNFTNQFEVCPTQPEVINPLLGFKFVRKTGALSVGFNTFILPHCDAVGESSQRIWAEIKRPTAKAYRRIGGVVSHTDGMREVLMNYGMPHRRYSRKFAKLAPIQVPCGAANAAKTKMRIKAVSSFVPNRKQTFQKDPRTGRSDTMRHGSSTFVSKAKFVCKPASK